MTPEEKAIELIDKFSVVGLQQRQEGVECARICVEQILILMPTNLLDTKNKKIIKNPVYDFWLKVKKSIMKQ